MHDARATQRQVAKIFKSLTLKRARKGRLDEAPPPHDPLTLISQTIWSVVLCQRNFIYYFLWTQIGIRLMGSSFNHSSLLFSFSLNSSNRQNKSERERERANGQAYIDRRLTLSILLGNFSPPFNKMKNISYDIIPCNHKNTTVISNFGDTNVENYSPKSITIYLTEGNMRISLLYKEKHHYFHF